MQSLLARMATKLPQLPDVERLSPRVIRILGGNPGKFTLQGTNTYLIGTGPTRILLDTGQGEPAFKSSLRALLDAERCTIDRILLSHWHHDHVKGVPDVRLLSPAVSVFKHQPSFMNFFSDASWGGIDHDERFVVSDGNTTTTLKAIYSPGHTSDHMCFLLEEESALFTADAVLGHGTAVFDDLSSYMDTLSSLSNALFTGRAYPGHGAVIENGSAKVKEYLEHRRLRERQVLDVLVGDKTREWGSMDVVKVVYKDYPEQYHLPAEGGVKQVLEKLELDGKIEEVGERFRFRGGASL